jgi:hydroxymethylpyrimidine/phosphomethylpyrimidine kinase
MLNFIPAPKELIKAQFDAIFGDFNIKAIKIGMLFNKEIIQEVRSELEKYKDIPIVFDPVAISKKGERMLNKEAIDELKVLFEISNLITPNGQEFKEFFNNLENAKEFTKKYKTNILLKDLTDKTTGKSIDVLIKENDVKNFQTDKVNSRNTYGTGSALSSAITTLLALGKPLDESIFLAKKFVYFAIKLAPDIGNAEGPINFKKAYEEIFQYL